VSSKLTVWCMIYMANAKLNLYQRIKNRMPLMVQRAKEFRATQGDPIDNLCQLFSDRKIDPRRWEEIIDEPYGEE